MKSGGIVHGKILKMIKVVNEVMEVLTSKYPKFMLQDVADKVPFVDCSFSEIHLIL